MNDSNNNNVCDIFCFDESKVNRLKEEVVYTEGLSQIFKALGDETRIKIIYSLAQEELCVCDIAQIINSSVAAASHHLRLLKSMGLARSRRQGKMVFYYLTDSCIKNIVEVALKHYKGNHCDTK